jgi:hypothetical protein
MRKSKREKYRKALKIPHTPTAVGIISNVCLYGVP